MSGRRIVASSLGAYLGAVALIAFWPTHLDKPYAGQLDQALKFLYRHGVPGWVDYGFIESGANVLLFIPFGFLLALLLGGRRWWLAMPIGCAGSGCIELGQLFFLSGRTASVGDVVVNTFGAVVGSLLARRCMYLAPRLRTEPQVGSR